MEILVIIILVVASIVIWRLVRNNSSQSHVGFAPAALRTPPPPAKLDLPITVSVQMSEAPRFRPDVGPLTPMPDGGWLVNPKASFSLTLDSIDQKTAEEFKAGLEAMWEAGPYNQRRDLVELITTSNVKVREIEAYVRTFRPKYTDSIERLKEQSPEWSGASEKDKEDLLTEFRTKALDQLDIQPNCDLLTLFECEPADATIDDSLVAKYGFEAAKLYVRHAANMQKVHTIPADHRDRSLFEELASLGLAIRGAEIPVEPLLSKLTLKEMGELVSDLNPPAFRRKAVAIEYLQNVSDIRERLGKHVAFRELFQLRPLPPEFASLDLTKVAGAWQYAEQVAHLLTATYWDAGWDSHNAERFADDGYDFIKGWTIDNACECCPYCERQAQQKSRRAQRPKVPLHIGCTCRVESVSADDL